MTEEFTDHLLRKDYSLRGRGERHKFPLITRAENKALSTCQTGSKVFNLPGKERIWWKQVENRLPQKENPASRDAGFLSSERAGRRVTCQPAALSFQ